jgi:hypothetical protein
MADGQFGPRAASSWPIMKIFSAFRIALDLKKLALAAAGIVATSLGWWVLCLVFYSSEPPQWERYERGEGSERASWSKFERDRKRWNLLHRLAGPPTNDPKQALREDIGDVATSPEEYKDFKAVKSGRDRVVIDLSKEPQLQLAGLAATFKASDADLAFLKAVGSVPVVDLVVGDEKEQTVTVAGRTVKIETDFEKLRQRRDEAKPLSALPKASQDRFAARLENPAFKPAGKFRVWPWSEDRGENPYLLTTRVIQGQDLPFVRGGFVHWLLHDQLKVLLEPLVKFVSPVYYLFQSDAGGFWNSSFLILIILWNLAVWGYFGGAISRLAAVQFARNEKIPLGEALAFVNQRAKHFFLAPVFPLVLLLGLSCLLGLFGFITGWTHFFGDIVIAGLLWPVMLLLGLIMVVVLMGLFAWPIMSPTIVVEGSDSFDALSRSYSYLYQSPWKFVAYAGTALLYGAAVVFFVGFIGSLTVYLGKWGFNQAPGLAAPGNPEKDRTAAYFFVHAPTSFGWRDLLLHDSEWAQPVEVVRAPLGSAPAHWELQDDYVKAISWNNRVGGWMVTIWLGLVFLLIVGFGYSYFWTAGTILYFLMRKQVDDVDFDEVHLDEDEIPPPPPPLKEPPAKPGTLSLNVVEAPRPEAQPAPPPPSPPAAAPPPPPAT